MKTSTHVNDLCPRRRGAEQVEIQVKYEGYIAKEDMADRLAKLILQIRGLGLRQDDC